VKTTSLATAKSTGERAAKVLVPAAAPLPAVMTMTEAAAFLRLSQKTLAKYAEKGLIPHRKIGPQWRFLRSDLEKFVHGDNPSQAR